MMAAEDDSPEHNGMLTSAQNAQENFSVVLEMMDGLVAETVRHGWSDTQARTLVLVLFTTPPAPPSGLQ